VNLNYYSIVQLEKKKLRKINLQNSEMKNFPKSKKLLEIGETNLEKHLS